MRARTRPGRVRGGSGKQGRSSARAQRQVRANVGQRADQGAIALHAPDYIPCCVAGIELMIFGSAGRGNAPLVLVTHSLGGNGTDVYPWCRDLVADGFVAVALEQRNHGRRLVNPVRHRETDPAAPPHVFSLYVGTALDVSLLIDLIPAQAGLSTERVGMVGHSLGGLATLTAMALDPRLSVGVAMASGTTVESMWNKALSTGRWSPQYMRSFLTPALRAAVDRYDVGRRPQALANRPVLILNGAQDNVFDNDLNRAFVDAAAAHYSQPGRIQFRIDPNVGHAVTPDMWRQARRWLSDWLLRPGSAGVRLPPGDPGRSRP